MSIKYFINDEKNVSKDLVRLKQSMLLEAKRLFDSNKYADVVTMAQKSVAALGGYKVIDRDDELSELYAIIASAHWNLGNRDNSISLIRESSRFNRGNHRTLALLREINGLRSETSQLFWVGIAGKADRSGQVLPFLTSYEIVADELTEAKRFILEYDLQKIGPNFEIDEAEIKRAAPGELKGIYSCMGLIFYDEE